MPKQTFDISLESSVLLKEFQMKQQGKGIKLTLNDMVSEAIKLYCLTEQKDRAEEIFEKTMKQLFQKYENRIASMVAAVGVDTAMILSETLENRSAYEENRNKQPEDVYQELRQEGVALFNRHRAFRLSELK